MAVAQISPSANASKPVLNPAMRPNIVHGQQKLLQHIESSEDPAISAAKQSLRLLYQSTISHLNEELAPYLGETALQEVYQTGQDVSPAVTADRIVSLATAFYPAFQAQHPEQGDSVVLGNFINTISEGIDRGFSEAREILQGLGVLKDNIATDMDKTYELVQDGLAAFTKHMRSVA